MKKIRVVQMGTAHDHAGQTFRALVLLSDLFEIVGVAEPNPAFSHRLEEAPYKDYPHYGAEEILDLPNVQAATIETAESDACAWAQRAIDRGLAVHLDKPGASNEEDFFRLADSAKERGLVLHLGYMYRYNPIVRELLAKARAGALGEIVSVEAQMSVGLPDRKREWLSNFDGGMFYYLGCHLVDLLLLLQGVPKRITPYRFSTLGKEDFGMAVFEYERGVSTVKAWAGEVNGYARRQLVVTGTKGTVELKPLEISLGNDLVQTAGWSCMDDGRLFPWGDSGTPFQSQPFNRYEEMLRAFAGYVRGGKNPYDYEHEKRVFHCLMQCCKE